MLAESTICTVKVSDLQDGQTVGQSRTKSHQQPQQGQSGRIEEKKGRKEEGKVLFVKSVVSN